MQGPPFPLDRDAMLALAGGRLEVVALEELEGPLWRAELPASRRPDRVSTARPSALEARFQELRAAISTVSRVRPSAQKASVLSH